MFISWPVLLQHASMIQLLMVELKGEEKNNNHMIFRTKKKSYDFIYKIFQFIYNL